VQPPQSTDKLYELVIRRGDRVEQVSPNGRVVDTYEVAEIDSGMVIFAEDPERPTRPRRISLAYLVAESVAYGGRWRLAQ
jgi:hypothetical protein